MTNPKKHGIVSCSDNVEFGTFFYGTKASFVKLKEKFHVGQTFNVKLDIKPRLDTGILMSVHGKKDYFILEMVNGSMKLTAENGLGPITAIFEPKTPYYFCDGNWHNIQGECLRKRFKIPKKLVSAFPFQKSFAPMSP